MLSPSGPSLGRPRVLNDNQRRQPSTGKSQVAALSECRAQVRDHAPHFFGY